MRVGALAARDRGRAEAVLRPLRTSRRPTPPTTPARRPGDRRDLQPPAERPARPLVDPGDGGGQARALREADRAHRRRGAGAGGGPGAHRPARGRGLHGAPPSAMDRGARARPRRRARRGACDPDGLHLTTFTDPANIRNRPQNGGGGLYDIGCYAINTARFLFEAEPERAIGLFDMDPAFGTDRLASGPHAVPRRAPGELRVRHPDRADPARHGGSPRRPGCLLRCPSNARRRERDPRRLVRDDGADLFGSGAKRDRHTRRRPLHPPGRGHYGVHGREERPALPRPDRDAISTTMRVQSDALISAHREERGELGGGRAGDRGAATLVVAGEGTT